jgi:phosphoribosyl-ATP pyrophosphohydrolase
VGEEAVEVVIAAKNSNKGRIISESADLLFHLMILLEKSDVRLEEVYEELEVRNKK